LNPLPSISVRIDRSWDTALFQTEDLTPEHCTAVLLTWEMEPPPIDAGVPAPLVEIVSRIASEMGPVAFRLFFPENLPASLAVFPAPRPWWPVRLYRRLTRTWPADLAIARDATAAEELFSQDWALQGQTALVLNDVNASGKTLDRLRQVRDWRGSGFPEDVRLLIAPAVDGDGILFAAGSAPEIEEALGSLLRACRVAGLSISDDTPM
jgi:hypothetical protein